MDDQIDRTIYVGNLSENVTEEILFELFLQAGPLVNVVIKQTKNSPARFSFVIFRHSQSVPYAIELFRDTRLYGRPLTIRARMESKHANTEIDTTDTTPIDLQHKVLEFITHNPELNADLQFPEPVPARHSRTYQSGAAPDDEDSYDPMSNFSVHSSQNYQDSKYRSNNDEYDPYEPLIREQRNSYSRNSSSCASGHLSNSSNFSVSSSMQKRLGPSTGDSYQSFTNRDSSPAYGKRRYIENDMMPYDKRFQDDDTRQQRGRPEISRSFSFQNPYERENLVGQDAVYGSRMQRSNSSLDRYPKSGKQNAYGRRQY